VYKDCMSLGGMPSCCVRPLWKRVVGWHPSATLVSSEASSPLLLGQALPKELVLARSCYVVTVEFCVCTGSYFYVLLQSTWQY